MPKLRISGALQYLLWFLGRNEKNKCGGVPKWLYMVGNLKKKSGLFKKTKWKRKKRKEKGLEQKEKKWKKNKIEVQFELYYVKLVELILFEKKNCAPLVFRNYFVLYYLFFIVKPLIFVAPLQPC